MLDWATEYSSVDIIRLTVQAHNAPAIHIYEKFGFERVAGSDAIVLDGAGKPVAAFDMMLDVGKIDDVTEADNISYLQSTTNNIILLAASDEGDLFGIISAAALPNHPREVEVGVAVLEAYQGFGLAIRYNGKPKNNYG
ncbi:hypothetical protein H7R52_05380 [Weissella confusa]|uniref:N-acetyltransferase domain-containing protein n=1 Tax=Weissella confusa TaxID=1583 RepID=A0A923NDA0_WEICO|nr:hypothetical protein [Weissella confusa]